MEEHRNEQYGTSVIVTDGREACPKLWRVAQVRMRCEKKVAQIISHIGHESFVPVQEEIHQWSDRKKRVERILIPMMVFFKTDEEGYREVERLSTVYGLLKAPGEKKAALIPEDQIERLKFMVGHGESEIRMVQGGISVGDRVRVVRGPLRGLEGNARTSSDGSTKIAIAIDYLGCATIDVSPSDIERM